MKTKFAAIIGMILIMTSAALPVQAAAAADGAGNSQIRAVSEGVSYADRTSEFRYLRNGWYFRDGNWYYVRSGIAVTGWVKYTGKWYFLDKNGVMETGWIRDNGKWYFLDKEGAMKTGWLKDGGKWYYLAANGQMKTGWVTDGGKKYYLTAGGAMKTGWLQAGGKRYYLTSSGAMKTGWLQVGGKKYYFDADGVLNEEKTREANGEVTDASKKAESGAAQSAQQTAAKTKGEMVAAYALQFVGNPYVYGGCSLTKGTDCSGFVMLIYRHFGVNLPHYDAAIRTKGKSVPSLQEAKAGDIICYYGHVAIYLGDGRIVHASNSRDGIKISERADYRTIAGIRRIFD
jgi:cell wall-associated NlpC family hydrolase